MNSSAKSIPFCRSQRYRDFASNVGINFLTPEEYFLHDEPQPFQRDFSPQDYIEISPSSSTPAALVPFQLPEISQHKDYPGDFKKINNLDIVIFCGSPGAGKSTFYWKMLQPLGYERVNQDTLKTVSPFLPWFLPKLVESSGWKVNKRFIEQILMTKGM